MLDEPQRDCWDNAQVESVFGGRKTELDGDGPFDNRQAARTSLVQAQRLLSSIGTTTPANKEHLAAAA